MILVLMESLESLSSVDQGIPRFVVVLALPLLAIYPLHLKPVKPDSPLTEKIKEKQ